MFQMNNTYRKDLSRFLNYDHLGVAGPGSWLDKLEREVLLLGIILQLGCWLSKEFSDEYNYISNLYFK